MTKRFIIAVRSFTYDLDVVKESMKEFNNGEEVTDEEAFDMIRDWAYEDLRAAISRHDIRFIDQNGEEI